jgi:LmbE family N-acetylglucosaminyl deacetylase
LLPEGLCGKNLGMEWVYLSPHLDDVALSCGGLVWEQVRQGMKVAIWTVCAGDAPAGPRTPFAEGLHLRWKTGQEAAALRRAEDKLSCDLLGAAPWHFDIPDCIYRRAKDDSRSLYDSETAIFGLLHPAEEELAEFLANEFARLAPEGTQLVCPLTIGGHVDHRLTRLAAERTGQELWYYADYPYVSRDASVLERIGREGWVPTRFAVSENGLEVWQEAVGAHASQVSSFWSDTEAMQEAIHAYWQSMKGVELWRRGEAGSSADPSQFANF